MNLGNVKERSTVTASTSAKSNFGRKGWELIIFVGIMLMLCTDPVVDGMNVSVPALAALHGWDTATLLSFATISNLVSIAGSFLLAWLCIKKGPRITVLLTLLIGGASYIWYGFAPSLAHYVISLCLVATCANVYAWIGGGAYLANWFPKKKGLALGWATMGNNLGSGLFVPVLAFLSAKIGIQQGIGILGAFIMVLAIPAMFFRDTPEEAGCTPDNEPLTPQQIKENKEKHDSYVSPWTIKKMLMTKELWLIGVSLGFSMLVTVGVMSQLVPRLISFGFSPEKALFTLTICAIIGIAGSYGWGVIDQLISSKKATAIFCLWYAVAVFVNLIPHIAFTYLSIVMIGVAIGGTANFPASLTASVFGRYEFSRMYAFINPFITALRALSFIFLAVSIKLTGSMTMAYISFIFLSVLGAGLVMLIDDKKYVEN